MLNNLLQKNLGLKIKKLRLANGYSQEVFAEKIDVAINTLSNIERGNAFMTSTTLEKIVEVLGVAYSELFDFPEEVDLEKLYKSILSRLKLFKNNSEKLKILDFITKNLL